MKCDNNTINNDYYLSSLFSTDGNNIRSKNITCPSQAEYNAIYQNKVYF